MNKKMLIWVIVLFAAVIGGAYLLYINLAGDATPGLSVNATPTPTPSTNTNTYGDAEEGDGENAEEGGSESAQQDAGEDAEQVEAPDFTVENAEGESVLLSDLEGKPVVLNFWASWCGPCQSEMPEFEDAYLELGEDIHFMMVNMTTSNRESKNKAETFISDAGYTFPVYYDTASEAAIAYGVMSLPTTYFIDADGYVIAQAIGAIDRDTLQRGIDMIA